MASIAGMPGPEPRAARAAGIRRAQRAAFPGLLIALCLAVVLASASWPVRSVVPGPPERTRVEPSARASAGGSAPRYAKIRRGDTLGSIAARAGVSVAALKKLNPRLDPERLRPGRHVKLPR